MISGPFPRILRAWGYASPIKLAAFCVTIKGVGEADVLFCRASLNRHRFMNRRRFIRATGVGLALPLLESSGDAANVSNAAPVQRMVAVGSYLGFHTPSFFPKTPGRTYQLPPLLSSLDGLRDDVSLFSGLDHRAFNGHKYWSNYLTGKSTNSISFDQVIAREIGDQTRFASLQVTCGAATGLMSFTKEGISLPPIGRPSVLYGTLFSSDSGKARMEYMLNSGRSVLDLVTREAQSLATKVNSRDRAKLDEYFTSLREVEKNIQKQQRWLKKPAPKVDYPLPEFDPVAPNLTLECESIMYDLIALALETDSTRVVTFTLPGSGQVFTVDGERLGAGYHSFSHHGNDPEKIAGFNVIGQQHIRRFAAFLQRLKSSRQSDGTSLLDTSAVLYGSGMGDANTHNNSRLPIIVAGGSFRHGAYHAIDRDNENSATPLLGDLFLTLMHAMGVERDRFGSAKRNMNEFLL